MSDELRFEGLRKRLVSLLKSRGITDEKVLRAMGEVPRHQFFKPGLVQFAYIDNAFPIDSNQTISQPYTVAFQSQLLKLSSGIKVLEIGTGSGYQCAVLCAAGAKVYSIERHQPLYLKARQMLTALHYRAQLRFGDGFEGWPDYAPFDRIIVTAGAPQIPEQLLLQLTIGGLLVIPLGGENQQEMLRITRISETDFSTEKFGNFAFVPLLKGTVTI